MAKREYSNGLQHLKFMQRAKQREEAVKKADEDADDSHWFLPANVQGTGKRCTVIVEGDPKPGALLGRMSFQNCNASIDRLSEETEAIYKRRFAAAKEKAEGTLSAVNDSARGELATGEDTSAVTTEEDKSVQFKKPKVDDLSASLGGRGSQSQSRNDNKTWQGWRSQGDYRMLRPPSKG